MAYDLLIMSKDEIVMRVNFDDFKYEVVNDRLLPYQLKNKLKDMSQLSAYEGKKYLTYALAYSDRNKEAVKEWLGDRTLLLSRANAKWIYNLLNLEQLTTIEHRAKVALTCRAVSLTDNYWVKLENDNSKWADVNLRCNPLNEVIAQVALHGKSLTLQGSLTTPELTTNGAYAKAWRRHPDGKLWLYKLGATGPTESKIEVMCSNLLDKMNVEHVHYEAGEDDGKYVCMCPCITTENLSILTGMDFISYCNSCGKDPDKEMMAIDSENIYKMWIVDYLISNRDRHGQNWGFFFDCDTMEILKCHPLFDHNNAFDNGYMDNRESPYQFCGKSIRECAKTAMRHVDFHFTAPITRKDFMTTRQYEEFMWRANDLGIETIVQDKSWFDDYCTKLGISDRESELQRLQSLFHTSSMDELKTHVEQNLL